MPRYSIILSSFLFHLCGHTQIISGPMLGPVELRDAKIWVETNTSVKKVQLIYNKRGEPAKTKTIEYKGELGKEFNPIQITVGGLDINTTYDYGFLIDGKPAPQKG